MTDFAHPTEPEFVPEADAAFDASEADARQHPANHGRADASASASAPGHTGRSPRILTHDDLLARRAEARAAGLRVVQCHGCFDIVHPGHIRHLEFARTQGDILLVSISGDAHINKGAARPLIPQDLRAENLAALTCVDWVVIDEHPTAVELLEQVQPDIYIKGREYENNHDPRFLAERRAVERHGGRVMFSSGDIVFSSSTLINRIGPSDTSPFARQVEALGRVHDLRPAALQRIVDQFAGCRVVVVGDAILDTYVFCDRPTLSDESPTLTLRPGHTEIFDGGATHVARQLAALGAEVEFVTALPDDDRDPAVQGLVDRLEACGVTIRALPCPEPVTEFRHYYTGRQESVRIDHGRPINLDEGQREAFLHMVRDAVHGRPVGADATEMRAPGTPASVIVHPNTAAAAMNHGILPRFDDVAGPGGRARSRAGGVPGQALRLATTSTLRPGRAGLHREARPSGAIADAVILCDFGRGLLTPAMFSRLIRRVRADAPLLTACISGRGSNFNHLRSIDLMCVTEDALREATGSMGEGLGAVVWQWFEANAVQSALVTVKEEGVIAFSRLAGVKATSKSTWMTRLKSAHVPAIDPMPLDASGSRSSLLSVATLARAAGADLVQAACLGTMASAIEGRRLGHVDITPQQLAGEWHDLAERRLRLATAAVG